MLNSVSNIDSTPRVSSGSTIGKIARPAFCSAKDSFEKTTGYTGKQNFNKMLIGGVILAGAAILGVWAHKSGVIKSIKNNIVNPAKPKPVESQNYLDGIETIQSDLSAILGRNLSKDEANQMALRYKEIFQKEDNSRFMGELFEQLKKDYNLPDMKYYLSPLENRATYAEFSPFSGVTYNLNNMTVQMEGRVAKITSVDRENIAKALAHELKHAQQFATMFGADMRAGIKALAEREQTHNSEFFRESMRRCANNRAVALSDCEQRLYDGLIDSFKNIEQIPKDSPLYKKGLEYIESNRTYITASENYQGYLSQLVESEAFNAGDRFSNIYNILIER